MVEKVRKTAKRWLKRHSFEAVLRLAEGQSAPQLAVLMGFNVDTVRNHIKSEHLDKPESEEALLAIALSLERKCADSWAEGRGEWIGCAAK